MRRGLAVLLLTGALAVLASLYLPWQEASFPGRGGVYGLGNLFAGNLTIDGRSSLAGEAAVLFALLLVALAAAALIRPNLAGDLPLGLCTLLAAYFTLADIAQIRSLAQQQEVATREVDFHSAYGAYLGGAGALMGLLTAFAMRHREFLRRRSALQPAFLALVACLLIAVLLPWELYPSPRQVTLLGIAHAPAAVAAALALCSALARRTEERLVLAAATALFSGAAVSSVTYPGSHAYGAWVGLGIALALVALALRNGIPVSRAEPPGWYALVTAAAAGLVVVSLFLPWQSACSATGQDFGASSGRCFSTNGWISAVGSVTALLAIALVIAALAPHRLAALMIELAAGIGLLVATLGFALQDQRGGGVHAWFGYGAKVGFGAAALLVVLTLARLRPVAFDRRALPRLVPIAACVAYLAVVVLPWWGVLPWGLQLAFRFGPISWLTIAGVLLAIRLLCAWARQIADTSANTEGLVLLPTALLGVAALDLIRLREGGLTWAGGAVVGLCLLLVLLGRIEQREGLESFRIPEILRVDRL